MKLKVKYHADIMPLEKIESGDWIDLRCAADCELFAGCDYTISLGVSIKLPEGYEAHIVPRSSTYKKWGIIQTNNVGIIDNSYCGENDIWRLPVHATRDAIIHKNDRICQFRIVKKQPDIEFETVDKMTDADRGGFGSTGENEYTKEKRA